jgi:hypothetical protein
VVLVGCQGFDASVLIDQGLVDAYVEEAGPSLPAKINLGFNQMPESVKFINWLGDDDLLAPGSLSLSLERLKTPENPVLVFGGCEYIDASGKAVWLQRSGRWAIPLLRFGPQLIPQPGSLYRRDAFLAVGELSTKYGWAFDTDLFIKLSRHGKTAYINHTLARFRWHPGSLSVGRRRESVAEASAVRISYLPRWLQPISVIWEAPVRFATLWAGLRLSRRLSQ